jgi:hypothetical protein
MSKYWIGVASANHVRLGRGEGFMQLRHGKLEYYLYCYESFDLVRLRAQSYGINSAK